MRQKKTKIVFHEKKESLMLNNKRKFLTIVLWLWRWWRCISRFFLSIILYIFGTGHVATVLFLRKSQRAYSIENGPCCRFCICVCVIMLRCIHIATIAFNGKHQVQFHQLLRFPHVLRSHSWSHAHTVRLESDSFLFVRETLSRLASSESVLLDFRLRMLSVCVAENSQIVYRFAYM